jgi:membrane protease YdiL (CAAX protease family)
VLLYALVAGLALSLGFVRGDPNLFHHPEPLVELPFWQGLIIGCAVGAIFGFAVVWITQRAVTSWKWSSAIRLHVGFRQILGVAETPLRESDILALALSSAIAEELLFRGWLVPLAGVALAGVAFGLLHYTPRSRGMWVWIPMAFIMGLAFGGMYVLTGNLAAPIVAHGVINYRNLNFINSYDPNVANHEERSTD